MIVILVVTSLGWLLFSPENNVRMWLNHPTLGSGEPLKLYIRNIGSKQIVFGQPYYIYRIYENGTIRLHTYDESNRAWGACAYGLHPLGTWSQVIDSDLAPGKYYLEKEYYVNFHSTHWTRKLYITIQ